MSEIDKEIASAKKSYLAADGDYAMNGATLENRVSAHVSRYLDPKEDRAEDIRIRAQEVLDSFRQFRQTRVRLATSLALVLLQMQGLVQGITIDALRDVLVSPPPEKPKPGRPAFVDLVAALPGFERVDAASVVAFTRALIIGERVRDALIIAANILQLRQAGMAKYLGDHVVVDADRIVRELRKKFVDDVRDEGFEAALKVTVELAGFAWEEVDPYFKVFKKAKEFRETILKIPPAYTGKGDVDALLEFAAQLRAEHATAETAVEAIDDAHDAMNASPKA